MTKEPTQARALQVGDTIWFIDGDEEIRLKDLAPNDASEWLEATSTEDIVGRTVVARASCHLPGAYGDVPATVLVLDDGSTATFAFARDDD